MRLKKFDELNEELHEGEMEVKYNLEDMSDENQERYYNFMEEYNELVLRTGLKVSNFHGDVAIYNVKDDSYENILIVDEDNKGTLYTSK